MSPNSMLLYGGEGSAQAFRKSRLDRAVRALRISGRRLMEQGGSWAVRHDGRRRRIARLEPEEVALLAADGMIVAAPGGGYVLAATAVEEVTATEAEEAARAGPWIFHVAGGQRLRVGGTGFARLARRARVGEGPLSLRQAMAGLRFIADVEQAGRDPALTMNWEGVPADKQRRAGRAGGHSPVAQRAESRLRRLAAQLEERDLSILWSACIQQAHLDVLEHRFGLPHRGAGKALAAALENLAAAYDG